MKRIWLLDFLRGIAILFMVIYNGSFAYYFLNGKDYPYYFLAYPIAFSFIFISGIALGKSRRVFGKFLGRFLKLGAYSILISILTYVFYPACFVKFGILHFFSTSSILLYLFFNIPRKTILGILIILIGLLIYGKRVDNMYLFVLGLVPKNFCSLDYFPLLPWFGVYLLGLDFSKRFNPKIKLKQLDFISFLGKHSLTIYLIHIPLILLVFLAAGLVKV